MPDRVDLTGVPIVDHHCHPYRRDSAEVTADHLAGHFAFAGAAVMNCIEPYLSPDELRSLSDRNLGTTLTLHAATADLAVDLTASRRGTRWSPNATAAPVATTATGSTGCSPMPASPR